jgi:hypothetical protein
MSAYKKSLKHYQKAKNETAVRNSNNYKQHVNNNFAIITFFKVYHAKSFFR